MLALQRKIHDVSVNISLASVAAIRLAFFIDI